MYLAVLTPKHFSFKNRLCVCVCACVGGKKEERDSLLGRMLLLFSDVTPNCILCESDVLPYSKSNLILHPLWSTIHYPNSHTTTIYKHNMSKGHQVCCLNTVRFDPSSKLLVFIGITLCPYPSKWNAHYVMLATSGIKIGDELCSPYCWKVSFCFFQCIASYAPICKQLQLKHMTNVGKNSKSPGCILQKRLLTMKIRTKY